MSVITSPTMLANLQAREAAALLPVYRRRPVAFVAGRGSRLVDSEGREYLDFLSGLSVTSLGHAHPAVADAVARQAATLVHTCNLYYTVPQIDLAERLQATLGWPDGKAFFCNSGAEANEAAIKLARRHGKAQDPSKVNVVALEGGFHGRLLGALLLTGYPAKHEPFQPLGEWVTHVPHDDPDAMAAAVDEHTCAVWVEVVQGEGGVRPVPAKVLAAARDACDRVGALLVCDEVQTGVGRLGAWYGWQRTGVVPDVVCLAKALANGLPIGAIVARGPAAEAFAAGDHASTFGGNPVACAAALAVLDTIAQQGLVEAAAARGAHVRAVLDRLIRDHPLAVGARGDGLLQALVLDRPMAGDVVTAALELGLVVNDVAPDAVRLAPALTIGEADVEEMAIMLHRALTQVETQAEKAGHDEQGLRDRGRTA
jgi:acetylornithine aminotransferase